MLSRIKTLLLTFLAVLILNSCGSQILSFKSLVQDITLRDFFSQTRQPGLIVFTNVQQVDSLLPQLIPSPITGLPLVDELHQLDYDHFFAVLVLQGQSGGQSSVTVQKITRQSDRVVISAEFITPGSGEIQAANVTDAYHLVAIPKDSSWAQQIQFELVDTNIVGGGVVARTTRFIP